MLDRKFGPIRVSIDIDRNPLPSRQLLSPSERNQLIGTWAPLPTSADPVLLEMVTVPEIGSREGALLAGRILERHGVVVVPDFVDRALALDAGACALAAAVQVNGPNVADRDARGFQVEIESTRDYYELANDASAIINVRGGEDAGMLDIFNFDRIEPELGGHLREKMGSSQVVAMISGSGGSTWRPANLNVYVNRGISRTRMFHVDAYGAGQVKSFVYLTDVNSVLDGPYTYVLDSHKPGPFRDFNLALTRESPNFKVTDTPLVDVSKILAVTAPAGSLVISNQSGSHRGYPQGRNGQRVAAVLNMLAYRG